MDSIEKKYLSRALKILERGNGVNVPSYWTHEDISAWQEIINELKAVSNHELAISNLVGLTSHLVFAFHGKNEVTLDKYNTKEEKILLNEIQAYKDYFLTSHNIIIKNDETLPLLLDTQNKLKEKLFNSIDEFRQREKEYRQIMLNAARETIDYIKKYIDSEDKSLLSDLTDVLESGEVITRKNPALDGEIRIKRGGLNEGLVHIIDHRIRERVLNKNVQMDEDLAKKETSAILFLAVNNIDKVTAEREKNGNYSIDCKGIKTILTKDKKGHYVLTGFDDNKNKMEATESINAVIADYGTTPEFLGIYAQVGAVIASYNILPQSQKNTSENSQIIKIEVNGKVRECKNGLEQGFKNAVSLLDKLMQENQILANENDKLRRQIKSQNKGMER